MSELEEGPFGLRLLPAPAPAALEAAFQREAPFACTVDPDLLQGWRDAGEYFEPRTGESLATTLAEARVLLAELDSWRPPSGAGPDRLAALRAWQEQGGGTRDSLHAALAAAPVRPFTLPEPVEPAAGPRDMEPGFDASLLALWPVANSAQLLAFASFGGFNSCPATELHVALAMRWERDLGARLVHLGNDTLVWRLSRPLAEHEVERVGHEHSRLHADERPARAELAELRHWRFWWD